MAGVATHDKNGLGGNEGMKEAYYFSHDANARHDPKCSALIGDFGMEGYGVFWMLIEIMAEQREYKLEKFPKLYEGLARQMHLEPDRLRSIIEAMLHDYELLLEDENYIWSESLLRRMEIKDAKRQAKVDAGRLGGIKSGISRSKRSKTKQCLKQNEANEPKERKVNIKESTCTPPIVPPEAKGKKKPDGVGNNNVSLKKIYDAFSENIHPITPFEAEGLAEWIDEGMDPDAITWAIRQAVLQGKRTAKYIDAIIRNLHDDNITTVAGAEARERNRRQSMGDKPGGPRAREPTGLTPEEKERLAELNRKIAEKMSLDAALEGKPPDKEAVP